MGSDLRRHVTSWDPVRSEPIRTTGNTAEEATRVISVDTHEREGWTVIAVAGEVDVVSAPELRGEIVRVVSEGSTQVVLDLTGVVFIDSFGLGVLVGAVKRVQAHDGRLRVVVGEARVTAVLELTGLDRVLDLHDTLESALTPPGSED
jgi:anti-sigma B factor antagonist